MPDQSPVSKRNAEWADIFGGASTNLAQRQRYANDQASYAAELLAQRQQAQYDLAQHDKTAQDFYFRQQELDRKEAMDKETLALRHQQQENRDKLLPAQIETRRAAAAAAAALELHRLNSEKRQADVALKHIQDTDQFEQKQNDLLDTAAPGSQDFADATLKNIAAHPFIAPDLRKTWLAQAGIKNDPDQLMRDTAQFRDTHNTQLSRDSKGQWEVKLIPKTPPRTPAQQPDEMQKRLSHLENLRMKPNVDPDVMKYLDSEITNVKGQMAAKPSASPTAGYQVGDLAQPESASPQSHPPADTTISDTTAQTIDQNVDPAATSSPIAGIPQEHIDYLKANPHKAASFDATYGQGASDILLNQ